MSDETIIEIEESSSSLNMIIITAMVLFIIQLGFILVFKNILNDSDSSKKNVEKKKKKKNNNNNANGKNHKDIVMIDGYEHLYYKPETYDEEEIVEKSEEFYNQMNERRSVRFFSDKPVPYEVIENIIKTAGTSPSGANQQPWTFVVISDKDMKHQIRVAAEKEEQINYAGRMNDKWQKALEHLGTDANKEYIDVVPYLIVVFKKVHGIDDEGNKFPHYYYERSVGIASGLLIAAIHNAGLATLTHTPQPMGFLSKLLDRPENEKPYLLMPVGYPSDDCTVPNIFRKPLEEIMVTV
eukprot:TRINITY_DN13139_c0_g1_i1.p1 TRINITY_DN13139_c0_g1~~TRINITY_DN13139_c0_g1_i1.p1  ORF type:complete len:296 (-),score=107.66 TRINITY_DN13139_c0_g1_i1:32-919(-)